jgi:hypothetical protein
MKMIWQLFLERSYIEDIRFSIKKDNLMICLEKIETKIKNNQIMNAEL